MGNVPTGTRRPHGNTGKKHDATRRRREARPCVFLGKDHVHARFHGSMTAIGEKNFERWRRVLGSIYREIMGREIEVISDGDTAEFLARGEPATRVYLFERRRDEP